jgi:hypothetical protein
VAHYVHYPQAFWFNVDGVLQYYTKSAFFANNTLSALQKHALFRRFEAPQRVFALWQ